MRHTVGHVIIQYNTNVLHISVVGFIVVANSCQVIVPNNPPPRGHTPLTKRFIVNIYSLDRCDFISHSKWKEMNALTSVSQDILLFKSSNQMA